MPSEARKLPAASVQLDVRLNKGPSEPPIVPLQQVTTKPNQLMTLKPRDKYELVVKSAA